MALQNRCLRSISSYIIQYTTEIVENFFVIFLGFWSFSIFSGKKINANVIINSLSIFIFISLFTSFTNEFQNACNTGTFYIATYNIFGIHFSPFFFIFFIFNQSLLESFYYYSFIIFFLKSTNIDGRKMLLLLLLLTICGIFKWTHKKWNI